MAALALCAGLVLVSLAFATLLPAASYLVRPDGYIGLADPTFDPSILERYCADLGIQPRYNQKLWMRS